MLADLKWLLDYEYGINLDEEITVHHLWANDLILISDSPQGLQKQLDGVQILLKISNNSEWAKD